MKKVDLHIHSKYSSDGELSPGEIVRRLKELNYTALSITDHDSMGAYPEVLREGEREGLEVIPGVEITTGYKGRETHLLGYFLSPQEAPHVLQPILRSRLELTEKRVKKLKSLGFHIELEDVLRRAGPSPPTAPIIIEIIMERHPEKFQGMKDPIREFYRGYFLSPGPAYVERVYVPIEEMIESLLKRGAVPVLAHPGAYLPMEETDILYLKDRGLQGIEVKNTYHDPQQEAFYRRMADKYSLVPTCGSDFHGKRKPKVHLGDVACDYSLVVELKMRRGKNEF